VFLVVLAAVLVAGAPAEASSDSSTRAARWHRFDRSTWQVTDVLSGDTIAVRKLRGPAPHRQWKVRLIGIDAPSRAQCGGAEAKAALLDRTFAAPADTDGDGRADRPGGTGRRVRLHTDRSQDLYERRGVVLAYVTTSAGTDLGLSQIRLGWSDFVVERDVFARYDRYVAESERALRRATGTWDLCGGDFALPLT
jgi:endonuclease YncB( thermonuclease family)